MKKIGKYFGHPGTANINVMAVCVATKPRIRIHCKKNGRMSRKGFTQRYDDHL